MPGNMCSRRCEICEGEKICICFFHLGYGLKCNKCGECDISLEEIKAEKEAVLKDIVEGNKPFIHKSRIVEEYSYL